MLASAGMFDPKAIRSALERLRAADPRLEIFGARGHRYHLHAPIAERELIMWERDHEVTLPDEYRMFLLQLGNGGVGPYYGIFPLGRWDGAEDTLESFSDAVGDLRAPFPHRSAWNLPASRRTLPEDAEGDTEYFAPSLTDGAFSIAHHGSAVRTMLVVSGPERGMIWDDLRPDGGGIVPRRVSFGAWYAGWLEQSLRQATARR